MCQDIRENLTLFFLQSSSIILLHLSFNIHQFHKIISIFEPFIRSNMTWSLLDALYLPGKREFIPDSWSLSLFSVNAKDQFWVLSVTRKIQYTFTTLNHLKTWSWLGRNIHAIRSVICDQNLPSKHYRVWYVMNPSDTISGSFLLLDLKERIVFLITLFHCNELSSCLLFKGIIK